MPSDNSRSPSPGSQTRTSGRLVDIARQAGVSEATVSRVLNDKPGVSADTRQAVLTALDVLGYERPDRLRKRPAGLIGLIVPELVNPIFPLFAQVIEASLAEHGYTPVLCARPLGGVTEDEYVEMLLDRQVSGIVFVSGLHADTTADHDRYRKLIDRPLPIVMINGYVADVEAAFISCDHVFAGSQAVSHLVSLGHRAIGLIDGPERYLTVQRKLNGYRAEMRRHGLAERTVLSLFGVEGGEVAAHRLLDDGITAIVAGSDLMALGAIRAARSRGLKVPEDVSVIGFDDSPLMAFTDPPLTTLRQPVLSMGPAAVRALIDEINGQPPPRSEYVFQPEFVMRGSAGAATGRPTGPEPTAAAAPVAGAGQ